ncbi:MAG: hypothetical protein WB239_09240 [Acidimicrobiia bacterium]
MRLRSERRSLTISGGRWQVEFEYLRPGWVETDSARVRIPDHLALFRLLFIVVWVVASTRRLARRS